MGSSGQLESVEGPEGSGRCPGEQAEVGEDLRNDGGMFDGGDDLQGAAAAGAVFQGTCGITSLRARRSGPEKDVLLTASSTIL